MALSQVVCSEDSYVSVERMEVLSGVLRRRNCSAELKERIVSETLEPGVTVTEVAHRHEVDRSLVYRWRRELGGDALGWSCEAAAGGGGRGRTGS